MGSLLSTRVEEDWKSDARYAMESGRFCVICGGPFDIEGDVYNIDPKEKSYQWLFDYRLLGSPSDVLNHQVTSEAIEPINTSGSNHVFLSENAYYRMSGSGYFRVGDEDDIWFDALRDVPYGQTLIPLHDACIEISCRVIERRLGRRNDRKGLSSLAILNQLLQSRFCDKAQAEYVVRNDLLDLSATSQIYGPRSVMALTKLEWWGGEYEKYYVNPIDVPNLMTFAIDILQASPSYRATTSDLPYPTREPHGLECLPAELLDQICNHLPPASVISLHRTSKALASKTPLNQSFWRNSLVNGTLLPHVWDLDKQQLKEPPALESSYDWKGVAQLLAQKRIPIYGNDSRLHDMPRGLWNRCRIWCIMEMAVIAHLTRSPDP